MNRSTDTLTKSIMTTPDYKKMATKGSIDSMDKSVISTDTSLGGYDNQTNPSQKINGLKSKLNEVEQSPSGRRGNTYVQKMPQSPHFDSEPYNAFELSYRNEGFRDNSTMATRNNSLGTNLNDDAPIIHQTDAEDSGSDYYGRSSTLPIRAQDNLSFLSELKQQLPEYDHVNSGHSSFIPSNSSSNPNAYDQSPTSFNSFAAKESESPRKVHDYAQPLRLNAAQDKRRPDSYYTAMRDARDSRTVAQLVQPSSVSGRPRTLYQSSAIYDRPVNLRSKSEALLESNFDEEMESVKKKVVTGDGQSTQLTSDNRSYSQPMETAM